MRCLIAIALLIFGLSAVNAQEGQPVKIQSPILTIDPERLNQETLAGVEAQALFEEEIRVLGAENERIFAELTEEEQQLTDERSTLDTVEFREKANAFDLKVQRIRTSQDEKLRLLQQRHDEARQTLLRENNEIILQIVRDRGAIILIDRRQAILSADTIDITDEAIELINAAIDKPDK